MSAGQSEEELLRGAWEASLRASLPVFALFQNRGYRSVDKEGGEGPLTAADLLSHHILSESLRRLLPEAAILSEEEADKEEALKNELVWVIDPIDGTRDFKAGNHGFAISIGLLKNGRPVLGALALPAEGLLVSFAEEQGLCAFAYDPASAHISDLLPQDLALQDASKLAAEFLYKELVLPELRAMPPLRLRRPPLSEARILVSRSEFQARLFDGFRQDLVVIPEGSIARKLALLAVGRGDLILSLRPKHAWDICGGHALLRADPECSLLDLGSRSDVRYEEIRCIEEGLVAGSRKLIDEFLNYYDKKSNVCTSLQSWEGRAADADSDSEKPNEVQRLRARVELLIRGCGIGLWEYDLQSGRLLVSPRWQEILAYDPKEFTSDFSFWKGLVHADDLPGLERLLRHVAEKQLPDFELEYRMRVATGEYRWMRLSAAALYDERGNLIRLAGSQMDINEDKAFDPITGLPNQILFQDRLEQAFYRARADRRFSFAVIIVSIDRFQRLIDDLGHSDVESLMQTVADRLQKFRREADTLARHTQNDFIFLVEDTLDITTLSHRISELPNLIGEPIQIRSTEIILTASIGFALYHENYRYPMDLLKDAITARKHSQAAGGNRSSLFNSLMEDHTGEILKKEMDLRKAIEEREMRLFYQPIVDGRDGRLRGFETLIRWEHPERGLLNPDLFIRLSEETGLIIPLGDFILEESMISLRSFQEKGYEDLFLSVNLSAQQLNNSELLDTLKKLLDKYKINPAFMKLEVTESVAMHSIENTARLLEKIHDLGFPITIDDFGTGYSSLSYLKRLPISVLKIDRSFVVDIVNSLDDRSIVQAILALAHKLSLDVVVEGVEDKEQVDLIQGWGCEFFQGYYFGRPIDASLLDEYLQKSVRPS